MNRLAATGARRSGVIDQRLLVIASIASLIACGGCGYGLQLVVGPTVDTFGRPGVEGRLTADLRFFVPANHPVGIEIEASGGAGLLGHEQVGVGIAGAGASVIVPFKRWDLGATAGST